MKKVRGIEEEIIAELLEANIPQRDLVMVEKGKQKIYSTLLYMLLRALVYTILYHTKALYSFEVGTHKFGNPFEAVSSTSHP